MKIIKLVLVVLVLVSCNNNEKTKEVSQQIEEISSQASDELDLEVYDFNGFEKFLQKKDGKTYVVNFWATWCAPCIKELPYFEKLNQEYKNDGVEVLLVSLDFPHLYDTKLKPFISENKLQSKVVALNDVDMNTWIPKVNEDWSGSIPATVIYKNDESKFYEQSFTYEGLKAEVDQFLK